MIVTYNLGPNVASAIIGTGNLEPELVDRICSVVPELWPGVLHEVGRIAEAGASLFITKDDVTSWTASKIAHETTAIFVKESWFWRGQFAARAFAARHAGFLIDLDLFTPEELDLEPIYRDMWRPRGAGWCVATAIPIPTGENLSIVLIRRTERGPVERTVVQKLDFASPSRPQRIDVSALAVGKGARGQRNARRSRPPGAGSQ